MLALIFYTITIILICYMIVMPASTVVIHHQDAVATTPPPAGTIPTKEPAEEFMYSKSNPAPSLRNDSIDLEDGGVRLEDDDDLGKKGEEEDKVDKEDKMDKKFVVLTPSARQYYRSLTDHQASILCSVLFCYVKYYSHTTLHIESSK